MIQKLNIGKNLKIGIILSIIVGVLTIIPLFPLAIQYLTVKALEPISNLIGIEKTVINFVICVPLLFLFIRGILKSNQKFINVISHIMIYTIIYSIFSFTWLGNWAIDQYVLLSSFLIIMTYLVIGIIKDKNN